MIKLSVKHLVRLPPERILFSKDNKGPENGDPELFLD